MRTATIVSAVLLLCCSVVATAGDGSALRLLNRLAYGPRPGDVARVQQFGTERYIEQQLQPVAEPVVLQQQLAALKTTTLSAAELFATYGPQLRKLAKADDAAKAEYRDSIREVVEQAEDARMLRALYSPNQLQEVMVDFWFNHFNVYDGKGLQGRLLVGPYEREAIRPYVFGKFRDLLGATAKHPAMLFYLDNWRSTAEGFKPVAGPNKGKPAGLNENYAREVMELHTLGVNGGYSQTDVTELARILTGWTYDPRAMARGDNDSGFVFVARRHDHGPKKFLGTTFADSGQAEGERALDQLAHSPATAQHIAYQLVQYFVADVPPPALVQRVAARFRRSDGDLRETLRTLLLSPEFLDPNNKKFKTPYQYLLSALRASAVELSNLRPVLVALRSMGQPIYGCPTPDGWMNTQDAWLNPAALTQRVNFATTLGGGRLPTLATVLAKLDLNGNVETVENNTRAAMNAVEREPQNSPTAGHFLAVSDLQTTLRGLVLSDATQATIAQSPPPLQAALLLGSPEFMYR